MATNYIQIKEDNISGYGTKFQQICDFVAKQLYNNQTHFIYELLQNTEDALSRRIKYNPDSKLPKSITFRLYTNRLEVSHFGKPFDEADVRGICSIFEGTKKDDEKQIGKFGIGFKSVYAFTSSPEIHSGDENFCIETYIYPKAVNPRQTLPGETLFIFPFNNQSEIPQNTFSKIKNRLESLSSRTLLFLKHIDEISWSIQNSPLETYRREIKFISHNCNKIAVIGKEGEEWLVFDKPVKDHSNLKVEIAFLLSKDKQTGNEQIVSVGSSPLTVFLPTQMETDFHFLVQGPYNTTPARDNIRKDDSFNHALIEQTASLVAEILPLIREMGLLTVNFLNILPIRKSDSEKNIIYQPVFEKICQTLQKQPLLPSVYKDRYISALQAKLARSKDFRQLLTDTQLKQLYGDNFTWLSDEITQGKTPELYKYITEQLQIQEIEPEDFARKFNKSFIEQQSDEWLACFYGFLNKQEALWRAGDGILRNKPFIRLQDNTHVEPFRSDKLPNAYLPLSLEDETEFPTVKREVIENQSEGRNAERFLRHLGLSEPDVFAEVMDKIIPKYHGNNINQIEKAEHEQDICKIIRALKSVYNLPSYGHKNKQNEVSKKEQLISKLKETSFLRAINTKTNCKKYKSPKEIYFNLPDLKLYFDGNEEAWFLDETLPEQDYYYIEILEVSKKVKVFYRKVDSAGHIIISSSKGNYQRGLNGFDPECEIHGLKYALENPTYDKAIYIWNHLLLNNMQLIIDGEVQKASNKDFRNPEPTIKQTSKMGNLLRNLSWLPDKNGKFYQPSNLPIDALSEDFRPYKLLIDLLGMNARAENELAKIINETYKPLLKGNKVEQEHLEFFVNNIEEIKKMIKGEVIHATTNEKTFENKEEENIESVEPLNYRKELTAIFTQSGSSQSDDESALPPTNPINIDRYRERVQANILVNKADEPPASARFKKVPTKKWEAKNNEVRLFLKQEYQGKCQICDYTFSKRDRQHYFEGLYLVSQTRAKWIDDRGNVLCLCANCCAKFKQGSVEAEDILEQIDREVDKSKPVLHIKLCEEKVNIRFTKKHMIHLQSLLSDSFVDESD